MDYFCDKNGLNQKVEKLERAAQLLLNSVRKILSQTDPQSTEMEVVSGLGLDFGFWFR
jgi:hypothetical protein